MKTFKLHLIRHGLTAGNLEGRYVGGGTDLPLCDEGRAQLAELQARFDYRWWTPCFPRRCCGPLRRRTSFSPGRPTSLPSMTCGRRISARLRTARSRSWSKTPTFPSGSRRGPALTPEGAEPTADFHRRCGESLLKLFEYMIRMDVTEAACVTTAA